MLKNIRVSAVAVALSVIAWMLLPTTSEQAAAQSGSPYIVAVDLDIVPAEFDKFVELIKENGVATAKEPGCREFNVLVSAKDPHHVFCSRSTTTRPRRTPIALPTISRNIRRPPLIWWPNVKSE